MGDRAGGAALNQAALAGPDVLAAARALLGCELRSADVTLRLTEVEAYDGAADPASHAYRGRTGRNAVMFGPAGRAYVYFVFGMHWCLNVVCGVDGAAAAVLLRAGAVTAGLPAARARRPGAADRDLARGPARLVVALGIGADANGTSLLDGSGPVTLGPPAGPVDPASVRCGPRVGVAAAAEVPWRFWLAGEPSVSTYRRHVPRRSPSTKRV